MAILSDTFAPPTAAEKGRSGASITRLRASSSPFISSPARPGNTRATPSVDAWALCAAPKASLT